MAALLTGVKELHGLHFLGLQEAHLLIAGTSLLVLTGCTGTGAPGMPDGFGIARERIAVGQVKHGALGVAKWLEGNPGRHAGSIHRQRRLLRIYSDHAWSPVLSVQARRAVVAEKGREPLGPNNCSARAAFSAAAL